MGNFKWVKCVCSMLFIAFLFLLLLLFFFLLFSVSLWQTGMVPPCACEYVCHVSVTEKCDCVFSSTWRYEFEQLVAFRAIIMCIFCIVAFSFIFYLLIHLFIHYVFLFFSVKVTYEWHLSDCRWQSCCWLHLPQTLERAPSLHCSGKTNDRLVLEVSAEQHTNIQKC